MKTLITNSAKCSWLIIPILVAALFWTAGCTTQEANPLAGWKLCFSQDPKNLGPAIMADYQDFIQKLPPKERDYAGIMNTFEDGTGQHAVRILVSSNHTNAAWYYALIYDKENKRIKVIKYGYFRIMS